MNYFFLTTWPCLHFQIRYFLCLKNHFQAKQAKVQTRKCESCRNIKVLYLKSSTKRHMDLRDHKNKYVYEQSTDVTQ